MAGPLARPRWQAAREGLRQEDRPDNMVAAMEHTKLQGTYVDPRAGRIPFGPYAEKWLANQVQ